MCNCNYYVCVDDKFSKSFKTYSGKDAVYNFIDNITGKKLNIAMTCEKTF